MALLDDFEQANRRAKNLEARFPKAVSAHYDPKTRRIVVHLSSKLIVSFSPRDVEGLEDARPSQLNEIEISPSGFGVHFPALDADVYIPGLLEGLLGSKSWMASRLGQLGGQSRSRAKKIASRANGKLGGRPAKVVR
jgi:predicted component of type VI protein secretion system